MFRVVYRSILRILLVSSLGLLASAAVAQDSNLSQDQPKDQAQSQTDPKTADKTSKDAQGQQPADAVDPLKKPVSEKQRKKNERALKQELSKPYKKWLDEDVVYIITDEERARSEEHTPELQPHSSFS